MNELTKKRDTTIDCMKGIAITLMVIGHSGFLHTQFLSLFHMAVFFMISGYLWNDKYSESVLSAKQYILRKVKSLWLPFVLWNMGMLLCNNLFLQMHIFTDNPAALSLAPNITVHSYLTLKDMVKPGIKLLFFRTDLELGGATWFLATLFLISVLHLCVRFLCRHIRHGELLFYLIGFFCLLYCQLCCMGVTFPRSLLIRRAFFSYFPFLIGYYFRKYENPVVEKKFSPVFFLCSLGILLLAVFFKWNNSVGQAISENILVYGVLTVAGWYFCRMLSLWCPEKIKSILSYLGNHSLSIVLCHFLSFRLVSWIYVLITAKSPLLIASFPTITVDVPGWLWIVYTFTGIVLSLLLRLAGTTVRNSLMAFHPQKNTVKA